MPTLLHEEDFETDGNGTRYTTSVTEFSDGSGDYFTRTDGSTIGSFVAFGGISGASYFAAQDLDGEGGPASASLTLAPIDITGATDLTITGLFAEDAASDGAQDWDADALVHIEASIDGGPWVKVLQFASQGATNSQPGLDSDFDGIADGPALTDAFTAFGASIAGSGASLSLRITAENLEAGDEDIAFDLLRVSGELAAAEVVALNETFDSGAGFTTSTGFFSDGAGDYFGIAGSSADFGTGATPSGLKAYDGADGNYLTGMDLDGEGASVPVTAEWTGIDIAGLRDLTFQGSFAEFFDAPGDIDDDDYLRVEARIDGGAWQTVLAFAGAGFTSSGQFNGNFRQDTDLDGTGDGATLTGAFQQFTAGIAGSGSRLDLRFSARVEAGDEDFAVDNFRVIGMSGGETAPAVIARAGDGLTVAEAGTSSDRFTLELATAPAAPVDVTVAADGQSEVSLDGVTFAATVTATLSGTDPVEVIVRAIDDSSDEAATHFGALSFTVASADPDYNGLTVGGLTVAVADNDVSITLISDIQGSGNTSAMAGQEVTVEAVVTGLITNGSGQQVGYFLQEEDADSDGDAATSEGIYVFSGAPVTVGSRLRLTADVAEFQDLTELTNVRDLAVLETGVALPTATQITLGMRADFETYEGMRVQLVTGSDDALTVVTNFNLDRFGEIEVAEGNLIQPTQIYDAQTQATEVADLMARNAAARLVIEDSNTGQNPDVVTMIDSGDGTPLEAGDPITAEGPTLRLGSQLAEVVGIMDERYGSYRIQVDAPLDVIEGSGARPQGVPDVGGDLQAASFNVLNYFTTLSGGTGPNGDLDPRGATNAADLARQTDKLVSAITAMGAEVIALQEIENNGFGEGSAIATLVAALNEASAPGTWAFVDPGVGFLGTDAITAGIIYRADQLTLTGTAVLDFTESSAAATWDIVDQIQQSTGEIVGNFQRNRPALAATFQTADGAELTVAANHLKSKGASGLDSLLSAAQTAGVDPALIEALRNDPNFDQGDGQGFWNGVRQEAAAELASWLAGNPTGATGTDNLLVLGDLNSYAREDPVQALQAAGFTDLATAYLGEDAYSYVFDGQRGTLDYGMASAGLMDNVTGVAEWHINADEPDLLSYSSQFNDASFYNDDPFAVSDHDPLLVGLTLERPLRTVATGVDFEDRRLLLNRVSYSEDGAQVATDRVPVVARSLEIEGSDITVSAKGSGLNLLTFAGKGLGVWSPLADWPLRAEARQLDGREKIVFRMDDSGRLADALDAGFELTTISGRGQVRLAFYDDGDLVEQVRLDISDGKVFHEAVEAFDEVVVSATGSLAFEIAAVDFTRIEQDSFVFA
ncbi:ExeM/NucH family extracellular endonuclease [Paracoccus marinaquae]|uniref:ExeM/NucH family extracellular endonuclease n=1 Tax=Paracoccus marinaquae TaxID=2841926 RepID=A0ABS6AF42_9RHOB|nr:ExeM/NucH family extracellular endonuclease [Paracoccus marinaquae]MBU3029228.1 ExeM/NucH family extracellular endonuclease [Paracoccus marinaquae]